MAEAALIDAAKSVLPKLGELALNEAIACWSARGDLEGLQETMEMIEAVLRDAEEQQDNNHAVKLWLQRLRRALYDADDLFDEVLARDQSRKLMGTLNKVRGLFSASNPVWLSWNVAGKIRSIRQKLDKITADMKQFNFRNDQLAGAIVKQGVRDETIPDAVEVDIVGRVDDKKKILEMLGEVEETGDIPCVIAIVGAGGLGKTTLAQLVYNDDNVIIESFTVKAWACVYHETNDRKVIEGKILKSLFEACKIKLDEKSEVEANFIRSILNEKYHEVININKIRSSIGELLVNKRYLLVLDDVWDDDFNEWFDLFGFLKKGKRESKIIATMRSQQVAKAMGVLNSRLHTLRELDTMEAERLFNKFAFRRVCVDHDAKRTTIGGEIFNMCPKLPLVLRSVGSMLNLKDSLREWESVKKAMPQLMRLVEVEDNHVLKVLKVSYDHLPPHLKRCFAYCALFPKDHEFDMDLLIRMWVAQGFVQHIADHESLEDVGYRYFTVLLNRSFFLVEDQGKNGLFHKMHDIMHDLAVHVAREEVNVISECGESMQLHSDLRHIAFNLVSPNSLKFGVARQVRSIFLSETESLPPECFELVCLNFASLRVLDLHRLDILHVPDSIGELIHLRYLDFSENDTMEYLPISLTRLINLQTLNLSYCSSLRALPKRFCRLINLRHLNLSRCNKLSYMPPGFGRFTSLQTFEGHFAVNSPKKGLGKFTRSSGLDALMGLHCFSKKLQLRYGGRGHDMKPMGREAGDVDSNLSNSIIETNIKVIDLKITFESNVQPEDQLGMMYLQRLNIQKLEKLRINFYKEDRFPGWGRNESMTMTIPPLFNNLIEIKISNCDNCKILPSFSILPHLKVLSLECLDNLEYIEEYPPSMSSTPLLLFFPSLEELRLTRMHSLKGWFRFSNSSSSPSMDPSINTTTGEAQHAFTLPSFPRLSVLEISDNTYLATIPPLLPHVLRKVQLVAASQSLGQQLLKTITGPILLSSSTTSTNLDCSLTATPESFYIYNFRKLASLSLVEGVSKSITKLSIQGCPELCTIKGLEFLSSLQELQIDNCKALGLRVEEDYFKSLTGLRDLQLHDPELESLPSGIQFLTLLQRLKISSSSNLTAIPEWIGNLTQLQKLKIWNCSKLTCLPKSMLKLAALQRLDIRFCGEAIVDKCKETTGEYWSLIQHIPSRYISD